MTKFLLTCCAFLAFSSSFGQAKKKSQAGFISHELKNLNLITLDETCDSIGWPIPSAIDVDYLNAVDNNQNILGYVAGNNVYNDKAKGNFFDMTGSTANFLTRAILGLGPANGANGGNLTKPVNIKVYDGTSGTPGALIGTFESTLGEMSARSFNFTLVNFATPVTLPASKKIFLVLEFPTLTWTPTTDPLINDSISLLTSGNNPPPATNLAWEQWGDNSWHTIPSAWGGLRMIMHLYPLVSATANGCTLPVTFGSFTGKLETGGINLNWQTWAETDNNRFEIERSADALKYTAIGTINTKAVNGNHQGLLSYQFTDKEPLPGVNFYRIRQIDIDGASEFSKTIKIANVAPTENSIVQSFYPNPVSDRLIIQLGNGVREINALRFSDASGRVLSAHKPAVSPDGIINVSTTSLRKGLNFATIILADGQQSTIKVMKD
jgi:hypothetical protein